MKGKLEKVQQVVRELTVDMSGAEYEEFMHQLTEWASYQAECADWSELDG